MAEGKKTGPAHPAGSVRPADAFAPRPIPLHGLKPPERGHVHAWDLDIGALGAPLQKALAGEEAQGQPLTAGQRRFARRFYLRLLLGAYLGVAGKDVVLTRSLRGKPVLDTAVHETGLQFSMAKSENRVLIGVCAFSPIGVDLEPAERRPHDAMRVANRYFHPREAAALEQMDEDRRDAAFLRAWACKEAVVKASGQGIANQLCRFCVEMDPTKPAVLREIDDDDAGAWALALLRPDKRFLGAVALRHPSLELSCFRLMPAA